MDPQGRPGQVREISPLLGFDSRTVRSVASRYTARAVSVHECHYGETVRSVASRYTARAVSVHECHYGETGASGLFI
jgi:hypothetical protein